MSLPELTHLQFLILEAVADRRISGRSLRAKLAEKDVHKTGPAFYQLMARLEDSGFVEGSYEEKVVEGQRIKERFYEITNAGLKAIDSTVAFYLSRDSRRTKGRIAHG